MVHKNVFSSCFLFDHPCVYTSEEFMLTKSVFAKEKECFLLTFLNDALYNKHLNKKLSPCALGKYKTKEFVITSSV